MKLLVISVGLTLRREAQMTLRAAYSGNVAIYNAFIYRALSPSSHHSVLSVYRLVMTFRLATSVTALMRALWFARSLFASTTG
eukprot:scaffold741_cov79-Phaeocystis_antarctica.AAC.5